MHNFRNIVIWGKAREIVKMTYMVTQNYPKEELYGLTSQMRRASVSIISNIAEGSGKSSNKDFTRFLEMSLSSCFELESQIILAFDLNYIPEELCKELCIILQEEQKMIFNFIKTL